MKILFFNPVGFIGGAEKSLLDVLYSFRKNHPSIEIELLAGTNGDLLKEASALNVKSHCLEMPEELTGLGDSSAIGSGRNLTGLIRSAIDSAPKTVRYWRQLSSFVSERKYDLIHTNGMKSHILASLISRQNVVWHLRDFLSERPLMRKVLKALSHRVRGTIANSRAVQEDAYKILRCPVEVVHNAIDLNAFNPQAATNDLNQLSTLPKGQFTRVGIVSTYARWKGLDLFIEAARFVEDKIPGKCQFFIIGGPIYRTQRSQYSKEELLNKIRALQLQSQVALVDFQPSPAGCFQSLDVVVHASTRPEPFGRSIAEAMACGKPVVVSRGGGSSELFEEDTHAVSFTRGDARDLANQVVHLVEDPEKRARLGLAATQHVQSQFNRESLADKILHCYQDFHINRT